MSFQVSTSVQPKTTTSAGKLGSKGTPAERLWVIAEHPLPKDKDFLFSSPMGWSYDKILQEAGINKYYTTYFTDPMEAVDTINRFQPPILVCLDRAGGYFLPQLERKEAVGLWAGSLLSSPKLNHQHYIIP